MKKFLLPICLGTIMTAQGQTVKKVIIEDITGAWCGYCPKGEITLDQMTSQHPTDFIAITSHLQDDIAIPAGGAALMSAFSLQGVPTGLVDRVTIPGISDQGSASVYYTSYEAAYNARKTQGAIASISFANTSFNSSTGVWKGDINVNFSTAPHPGVPLVINALVLEDSIPATGTLEQHNYYPDLQGGASILSNWFHNDVLRMTSDGTWGDATVIPATDVAGTVYTKKNVTFTLPASYIKKNISLVAYVAYNGTVANSGKEIINADQIGLTGSATGIDNVNSNVSFLGIYPNPVQGNNIVKIEFNLKQSTRVSLSVYNILGQKVAEPYVSEEVKGMHTIQWRPSDQGLSKGTYILRLVTDMGSAQATRINVL